MKVKITSNSKKIITLDEMQSVKKIIDIMKDDADIKEYAEIAARTISGSNGNFEILKSEAEIAKNCRIKDSYFEGSGNYDVWIEFYAFNDYDGFYKAGCYLTDIWKIDGSEKINEEIRSRSFIMAYKHKNG